ncbi:MAG: type II secretion system F family protein [Xanthomonadales bacterium]|nr:type II secretion system F family protein [Xanthomonadales bacterium]ODU91711.1 MAG: type II secretion system protein GspF [Rhodanobacter sp. SCN 66-43]OJY85016.1 MAG: type II secretion system protein GspF [Xanthomonadales bacterium 66-474]
MASFHYKAVTPAGETVEGRMDAASVEDVIARLQEQGNVPLEAGDAAGGGSLFGGLRRKTLGGAALVEFTRQLGILLHAGLPLDRSLQMLQELPEGERARHVVTRIRDRVRGGSSLSRALEEEHGVFPKLYLSMVRAGEAGGALDAALARLADYLERARTLRESVIGALVYPAFLLFGVLGSLVLLLAFVLPQFVPIFHDMNVPIPFITRALMAVGSLLHDWGMLLLAVLIVLGLWVAARMRDPETRRAFDARLLRVRVLGPLLLKVDTARLLRTLGSLLKNGVSLLSALGIARQVVSNRELSAQLAPATEAVKGGDSLSRALATHTAFPKLAIQITMVGEESGTLDSMLLRAADTYDGEVKSAIDKMLAALVPVLTIVMALLVAGIMLSILLPLLSLTGSIQ